MTVVDDACQEQVLHSLPNQAYAFHPYRVEAAAIVDMSQYLPAAANVEPLEPAPPPHYSPH
jgi:hypothetical protein